MTKGIKSLCINYLSSLASEVLVYPSGVHIFVCANYDF